MSDGASPSHGVIGAIRYGHRLKPSEDNAVYQACFLFFLPESGNHRIVFFPLSGFELSGIMKYYDLSRLNMPRGLKETSSQLVISFDTAETAPNTFTQERLDLQLNALDNEVFVVTAIKLDLLSPDFRLTGVDQDERPFVSAAITKQSSASMPTLASPSCIATAKETIIASFKVAGAVAYGGMTSFTENQSDTPSTLDYLDIIATPDFFISILGGSNINSKTVSGKVYGYRARADAATYAGLVQSELLSQ